MANLKVKLLQQMPWASVENRTQVRIKSSGVLLIELTLHGELWICGINTNY